MESCLIKQKRKTRGMGRVSGIEHLDNFDHWIENKERRSFPKTRSSIVTPNMGNLEIGMFFFIFNPTTIPHGWLDRQPIDPSLPPSLCHALSPHISSLFLTCAWRAHFHRPFCLPYTYITVCFRIRTRKKKTLLVWCPCPCLCLCLCLCLSG